MASITGKSFGMGVLDVVEVLRHRETYSQAWHAHEFLELHHVLSGAISYEFANGHPPVTIPGGAFLAIPPRIRHRAVNDEGTPSVRCVTRWNVIPASIKACPFTPREIRSFFADAAAGALDAHRMPPRLVRAVREAFRVVEDGEAAPFLRLAVWSILAETALAARNGGEGTAAADTTVATLCTYVTAHCGEKLHLDDLVRLSGYSRRHLLTLFRQETGLTPGNYLTRCRIDRAKRMLAQTPRPNLFDVAIACGFAGASHFSSVFRKYVGVTPRAFR